jgi:sugar/nucleoside kinase (ribokinase family)
VTLKRAVGIDRALLRTAMGNDDAAEAQLRELDAWEIDTRRLRAHIAGTHVKRVNA